MGQRIGYARVSTDDQNLDLQLDALHRAGIADDCLYSDTASGKDAERKELAVCLKALREGDTLVVWRLDRLGRSLPDLVRIIGELEKKGVSFESLTEKIETSSAAGKLVFHVFAALAEFERNLIRERTRAGLVAARARGRSGGRRPKLTPQQIKEIKRLMTDPTIPVSQIAERYNVSRTTIYKVAPRRESEVVEAQPVKKKS
ncbi:TPA: recombinase family protein [Pseudomonas aeruginosa]|nr:recombinase family protein [Pseudomonas aeruginosa]